LDVVGGAPEFLHQSGVPETAEDDYEYEDDYENSKSQWQ
jgi:hypothetical protein